MNVPLSTTWETPIRHPWFDKPSMKRRLSPTAQDNTLIPPSPSAIRAKRRRCDSLEHGFADLTLEHTPPPRISSRSAYPEPSSHFSVDSQAPAHHGIPEDPFFSQSLISQNSVEDSITPNPRDINMVASSWYEPEKDRIVVTSLDGSESESDEPQSVPDVIISSALMDRMKMQDASHVLDMQSPECQALVLYRPIKLGLARQEVAEPKNDLVDHENAMRSRVPVDRDAMDIGP